MQLSFQQLFTRKTADQQPSWFIYLGLFLTIVGVLTRTGIPELAKPIIFIAMFIGFWALYKYGRQVNSHIVLRFVWIIVLIQFISWGMSQFVTPEWARETPQLDKATRWFMFIPLAWWIAQHKQSIWILWGSAAIGILVSPWVTGEGMPEILRGLNGKRVFFGLRQAQHTSLFFGIILIGLISFSSLIIKKNKWFTLPLVLTVSYCLLIIYINSSRQAWLSLLITAFIMTTYLMIKYFNRASRKKKIIAATLFLIGIIGISSLLASNKTISDRVMKEKPALIAIASLNFDDVPYSSFGIRLHSWIAATEFIKEKPIFGWGSNGRTLVIKKTEWLPEKVRNNFGHLHNTYIELWVNFGIIGLGFYLFMWAYFSRHIYKEVKAGRIEKEIGYFFAAFLCFWSVMNCFEAYQNFWTGIFFFNVFMAGIMSRLWRVKYFNQDNKKPNSI